MNTLEKLVEAYIKKDEKNRELKGMVDNLEIANEQIHSDYECQIDELKQENETVVKEFVERSKEYFDLLDAKLKDSEQLSKANAERYKLRDENARLKKAHEEDTQKMLEIGIVINGYKKRSVLKKRIMDVIKGKIKKSEKVLCEKYGARLPNGQLLKNGDHIKYGGNIFLTFAWHSEKGEVVRIKLMNIHALNVGLEWFTEITGEFLKLVEVVTTKTNKETKC